PPPPLASLLQGEGEFACIACAVSSRTRCSIGVSADAGIGSRPVSQSARSFSGSSNTASNAASSDSGSAAMCRRTKPPIRMAFSYVRGWVARWIRRRRLASSAADSGSLIGAVSYSRASTPCQPVDHDPFTPLFSPLTTLKGVGPTAGALIAKAAGGGRVVDLLFHLPDSYVDRRQRPSIVQARAGQIVT